MTAVFSRLHVIYGENAPVMVQVVEAIANQPFLGYRIACAVNE